MKKSTSIVGIWLFLIATAAWAQPFPAGLSGDPYDSTGDTIITPNDDNDNLGGDAPGTENKDYADINDAINRLLGLSPGDPGYFTNNEDVDGLQFTGPNATWKDFSDKDFEGTFVAISLTAALSNTLGVYDTSVGPVVGDTDVLGPYTGFGILGDGSAGSPYPAAFSPLAPGTNFGFYLRTSAGKRWDSNPANNENGLDHMLVYQLSQLKGMSVVINTECVGDTAGSLTCPADKNITYTFNDPFLIAWEDKPLVNGKLGDEDFDDMIYLVDRVKPVPEPISMLLFGTGLAGLAGLRRKDMV